jgi:hypothetical protein
MTKKLIAVAVLALMVYGTYRYFHKPPIARNADPGTTAIWQCPGCRPGSAVEYVDRRNRFSTLYYYDVGADGTLDAFQVNEFHPEKEKDGVYDDGIWTGYYDERTIIQRSDREAERATEKGGLYSVRQGIRYRGRNSEDAVYLQQQYDTLRAEYLKLNPGSTNLSENQPQVPAPMEPIRPEKINQFFGWVNEYRAQHARESNGNQRQRDRETIQFRTMLAFRHLQVAYRALSEAEQQSIFTAQVSPPLPSGIKLDGGAEITEVFGVSVSDGNAQDDFETFLSLSYMETDYMSGWSIARGDQMDKIKAAYEKELVGKGLLPAND